MNTLLGLIPDLLKKILAFVIAYSTALVGGYMWLENKIQAAEDNAIKTMKEYRQADMESLNQRLDDIKTDVGIIKKALIEGRR